MDVDAPTSEDAQPRPISPHQEQSACSILPVDEGDHYHSSQSASSPIRQVDLARKSSTGSTMSRQRVSIQQPTPTASAPMGSTAGHTHIGGIQPPAAFFRPQKPSNLPPLRASRPSTRSGEVLELGILPPRKSHESTSSFALSNQASTRALRTQEPKDAQPRRPNNSTGRSLLGPLLPIGGRSRKLTVSSVTSPTSPKSEIRASLDRLFRKTSSESKRPSPVSKNPPRSIFGRRPPSPIDLEIGPVIPLSRPSMPTSPTTPITPSVRNMSHSIKVFDTHPRPLSATFTDPNTDQSHTFIPHPILADPSGLFPTTTVPLNPSSKSNHKKVRRNHHGYPSQNRFLFGGRLMTGGGDSPLPFIVTSVLVLGLTGVWFGTTATFWWHYSAGGIALTIVGAYLSLLTITNMFVTAFRDPGILPRELDPDPPYPSWSHASQEDPDVQPLPRDIVLRQTTLQVKYCSTCRTYRPPRATHCRVCDNCVDGCDHHCQWLNTCVGRRNYTSFIATLIFGTITLIYVIVTSAFHVALIHSTFRDDLRQSIGSAVVFVLGIVVFCPLFALFSYHIGLLYQNMTTIERLRTKAHIKLSKEQSQSSASLPRNPFRMKWYNNIGYLLCRPGGFDWIEASKPQHVDGRLINPGAIYDFQQHEQARAWSEQGGHGSGLGHSDGHPLDHRGEDDDERVDPGYARESELMTENGGGHPALHAQEKDHGHAVELDHMRSSMAASDVEEGHDEERQEERQEEEEKIVNISVDLEKQ